MSNGLNLDQDRRSVGPDLAPNCVQRLSADDNFKVTSSMVRVKDIKVRYMYAHAVIALIFVHVYSLQMQNCIKQIY